MLSAKKKDECWIFRGEKKLWWVSEACGQNGINGGKVIPCAPHTRDTLCKKYKWFKWYTQPPSCSRVCTPQSVSQSDRNVWERVTAPHSAGKEQDDWYCGRGEVRDPHVAVSWLLSIISFVCSDVTLIMTQSRSPGLRVLLSLFPCICFTVTTTPLSSISSSDWKISNLPFTVYKKNLYISKQLWINYNLHLLWFA